MCSADSIRDAGRGEYVKEREEGELKLLLPAARKQRLPVIKKTLFALRTLCQRERDSFSCLFNSGRVIFAPFAVLMKSEDEEKQLTRPFFHHDKYGFISRPF